MDAEDKRDGRPDLSSAAMSADRPLGWYAYGPDGSRPVNDEDEDPVIEVIKLRPAGEPGPFYVQEQVPEHVQHLFRSPPYIALSDDFEELHRWLGISRATYDAAMAWNERWAGRSRQRSAGPNTCEAERQNLLARMRDEAHEGISFV